MEGLVIAVVVAGAGYALYALRPKIHGPAPGFERVPIEVPVHVCLDERELELQSIDISKGGMCLKMNGPANVGQPVELTFALPDAPKLALYGVVRWHFRDKMGVLFDLQDDRRATVAEWMDAHRHAASAPLHAH
jgi:PilZ domain-containing protein